LALFLVKIKIESFLAFRFKEKFIYQKWFTIYINPVNSNLNSESG